MEKTSRLYHKTKTWATYRLYFLISLSILIILHEMFTRKRHELCSVSGPHLGGYPPQSRDTLDYRTSWTQLATALEKGRPHLNTPLELARSIHGLSVEDQQDYEDVDAIVIDISTRTSLAAHHDKFIEALRAKEVEMVYTRYRRGIVITGGLNDYPSILLQLRLLKRTGSKLPIEIFLLGEDDYNRDICDKFLHSFNARCRSLEHLMTQRNWPYSYNRKVKRKFKHNEPLHKLLAIFFSTYEEVLLLGPNTLTYNNPDSLFKEEPFLSKGMILWPDFWTCSTSPLMSKIQRKSNAETLDKGRTVDMGQLVVSKSSHVDVILLATYYTYFGPGLYDLLLKQSNVGEDGSQAIKAAARYLESPIYMVKRFVEAVGFPDMSTGRQTFNGVAMLQSFPLEDYQLRHHDQHRPAFIKADNPPLNPILILDGGITSFTHNRTTSHRMWEWFGGRYLSNGWQDPDPERALWEEIANVACSDLAKISLYRESASHACSGISRHRKNLGFVPDP